MTGDVERAWIERARQGDAAAFDQLMRQHRPRVHAWAAQILVHSAETDDAVQETFLRAWRAIARFDGRAALSTWLYRICTNVCRNALRRRHSRRAASLDAEGAFEPAADATQGSTDPARAVQALELCRGLHAALDALSPTLRETVVLVLLDGMPQADAATQLGCSEGTIAWRVHEARRRLRSQLEAREHIEAQAA